VSATLIAPVVEARGLRRVFTGGFAALGPLDLSVAPGELVAVLGPSGSGKSTLLRLLGRLDAANAGTVRFGSADPHVGIVFQEPRLMPWLTVAENVGFGLFALPAGERAMRVAAALEKVALTAFADALPKTLSGGMAQRVGVARALALEPDLLLLDEPFGALDPLTRMGMQRHLATILEAGRLAGVLITHDVEEALLLADRVVVLRGPPGRIRFEAPIDLPRPRHADTPAFVAWRARLLAELDIAA